MKPDKTLEELDTAIAKWEIIVKDYPLCDSYKTTLENLQQLRVDYVSKIGNKKQN